MVFVWFVLTIVVPIWIVCFLEQHFWREWWSTPLEATVAFSWIVFCVYKIFADLGILA